MPGTALPVFHHAVPRSVDESNPEKVGQITDHAMSREASGKGDDSVRLFRGLEEFPEALETIRESL